LNANDIQRQEIKYQSENLKLERENLLVFSSELAARYHVESPISTNDSALVFKETISTEDNQRKVNELIRPKWVEYNRLYHKLLLSYRTSIAQTSNLNKRIKQDLDDVTFYKTLTPIGIAFFLIGLVGLLHLQELQNKLLKKQLEVGSVFSCCQSCGKSFGATVQNSIFPDGEANKYYCRDCFADNAFTNPNLTWQIVYAEYLNEFKNPNFFLKRSIKQKVLDLHRWKFGKY